MKYIFLLVVATMTTTTQVFAHDGNGHAEATWWQEISSLTIFTALVFTSLLLAGIGLYLPKYRSVCAGIGIATLLLGFVGLQASPSPTPVADSVMANLNELPVTVYRTEGCSCCTGFANELSSAGAHVTVQTITPSEMDDLKATHNIAPNQASCHTSVINGYVVEGHVPFAAIAQLVEERPSISGITLPGMPIGTPGMPGRQTETYKVTTLDNEPFWQSR